MTSRGSGSGAGAPPPRDSGGGGGGSLTGDEEEKEQLNLYYKFGIVEFIRYVCLTWDIGFNASGDSVPEELSFQEVDAWKEHFKSICYTGRTPDQCDLADHVMELISDYLHPYEVQEFKKRRREQVLKRKSSDGEGGDGGSGGSQSTSRSGRARTASDSLESRLTSEERDELREFPQRLDEYLEYGSTYFMEALLRNHPVFKIPLTEDDVPEDPGRNTLNQWIDMFRRMRDASGTSLLHIEMFRTIIGKIEEIIRSTSHDADGGS